MTGRSFLALAAVLALGFLGFMLRSHRHEVRRTTPIEGQTAAAPGARNLLVESEALLRPDEGERASAVGPRGRRVEVLVVDPSSGAPIADATVNGVLSTDAAGRASLDADLQPSGAMHIVVEASGHCSLTAIVQRETVVPEPLVLSLPPLGRFEGIVRDELGAPLPGVELAFAERDFVEPRGPGEIWKPSLPELPRGWRYWGETSAGATSDAEGRFVSSEVFPSPRPYEVRLASPYEATVVTAGHACPGVATGLEFALPAPPTVPMGTIQGTVTFDGGHVEGRIRWKCGSRDGSTRIFITGAFKERVPAGEVEVWATAHKGRAASPTVRDFLVGDHAMLTVEPDETTPCDLAVEIRGSFGFIGGRVLQADGRPPPRLLVRLDEDQARFRQSADTDLEGRWRGEVADFGTEYGVSFVLAGERFDLGKARAGDLDVDFVVPVLGALPVRVVDERTGRPIPRWDIGYRRRGVESWGQTDCSKADAATTLELLDGEYDLWVQGSYEDGYVPERVEGVRVRAGETSEALLVRLRRGFELEIQIGELPPAKSSLFLLEPDIWDSVRTGIDLPESSPQVGKERYVAGLLSDYTLSSRSLVFFDGRHAKLSGLAPGEYRFKAFPHGLVIEPSSVVLPHDGPLAIRWRWE